MATKKEVILGILESLILMGYGALTGQFRKDHVLINIYESLAKEEIENIMAKNLCTLCLGIFNGVFEVLGIDVDGKEIECVLSGDDKCSYRFDLLGEELDDKLVDEEISEEAVEEFLASL